MCMSLLRNSEKFGAGAGDVYGAGRKMYVGGVPTNRLYDKDMQQISSCF